MTAEEAVLWSPELRKERSCSGEENGYPTFHLVLLVLLTLKYGKRNEN
jgi:hypothetical protein